MTKEQMQEVVTDDVIKAVASAIMTMCDAILEIIPTIKETAEKGEMNDLIAKELMKYIVEGEANDD